MKVRNLIARTCKDSIENFVFINLPSILKINDAKNLFVESESLK